MYNFGKNSTSKLITADIRLQLLANKVIEITDHTIVTGHRDKKTQDSLYPKFTKVKWPNGKHNKLPSQALDVAPYVKPFGILFGNAADLTKIMITNGVSKAEAQAFILKAYGRLIGMYEAIAHVNNIKIRVGIDWDGDFDMTDQKFHDLGHIELN